MSYISIKSIDKYFGKLKVLDDINIEIEKGEFVSLLGPSGCGKTTLLRIISGLEKQNSGTIIVDGKDISSLTPSKRNISLVFQNYVLFPNLTVYDNIAYGLVNKKKSKVEIEEKVNEILKKVDLTHVRYKYPEQLSGGQQQRVSLARAVILSPQILLLDEPLSALDAKVRESLRREIKQLHKDLNVTTIMVTHDQEEALIMSDRIIVMNNSKIMQIGTPEEIYRRPVNEFVASFVGEMNCINYRGNEKFVRPEEVVVSLENKTSYYKARITNIEFRGAFFRIILESSEKEKLIVDILSADKERLKLGYGMEIYYSFNKNGA